MRDSKWNAEKVIAAIQHRVQCGESLRGVWRDHPALYRAAQTHCGSWEEATLLAGFPTKSCHRWSKGRVLEKLRNWSQRPVSQGGRDSRLYDAAVRYWGSWNAALEAAGVERLPQRKWSQQRVIVAIQDRHIQGQRINRLEKSARSLVWAARHYFGGWKQALQAAGLGQYYQESRPARDWSPEFVIQEMKRLVREGVPLRRIYASDPTLYSAAKDQFGTWSQAIIAAGYSLQQRNWSRQVIIEEIQERVARGRSLSSSHTQNRTLVAAAIRYFGSWHTAVQVATKVAHSLEM